LISWILAPICRFTVWANDSSLARRVRSASDHEEVVHQAVLVLRQSEAQVVPGCADRRAQACDFIGEGAQGRGAAGCIHRPIPEEGVQNAGQAAGQRDDGDVFTPTRGEAQGPGPERRGRGGPAAQDREGGLNELWRRLRGRPVSESGSLRHGDGDPQGGDHHRRGLVLATLLSSPCALHAAPLFDPLPPPG
jgi:hypothetical protein